MTEYIEREALEVALNHRLNFLMAENGEYDHYTSGFDEAVTRVENFPAADVAEVVRGKDCKYSGMYCFGTSKEETLACLETEEDGFIRFATSVKADDYCSRGERKMDKEVADDKKQPEEAPGE